MPFWNRKKDQPVTPPAAKDNDFSAQRITQQILAFYNQDMVESLKSHLPADQYALSFMSSALMVAIDWKNQGQITFDVNESLIRDGELMSDHEADVDERFDAMNHVVQVMMPPVIQRGLYDLLMAEARKIELSMITQLESAPVAPIVHTLP